MPAVIITYTRLAISAMTTTLKVLNKNILPLISNPEHKAGYYESCLQSKAAYSNKSWDLVDLAKDNPAALGAVDKEYLPTEYKNKSDDEIKKLVAKKTEERASYQDEISSLGKQRQAYIDEKRKEQSATATDNFGTAINQPIVELAKKKGYTVAQ